MRKKFLSAFLAMCMLCSNIYAEEIVSLQEGNKDSLVEIVQSDSNTTTPQAITMSDISDQNVYLEVNYSDAYSNLYALLQEKCNELGVVVNNIARLRIIGDKGLTAQDISDIGQIQYLKQLDLSSATLENKTLYSGLGNNKSLDALIFPSSGIEVLEAGCVRYADREHPFTIQGFPQDIKEIYHEFNEYYIIQSNIDLSNLVDTGVKFEASIQGNVYTNSQKYISIPFYVEGDITIDSDLSNVIKIEKITTNCDSLTITNKTSKIPDDFSDYIRAKSVNLPSTLVEIGDGGLKRIRVANLDLGTNIKILGDESLMGAHIGSLEIGGKLDYLGVGVFSSLGGEAEQTKTNKIEITTDITKLSDRLFSGVMAHSIIINNDSIDDIGSSVFANTNIDTLSMNVSKVSKIQVYAFSGAHIGAVSFDKMESPLVYIGPKAFSGSNIKADIDTSRCVNLLKVYLSAFEDSELTGTISEVDLPKLNIIRDSSLATNNMNIVYRDRYIILPVHYEESDGSLAAAISRSLTENNKTQNDIQGVKITTNKALTSSDYQSLLSYKVVDLYDTIETVIPLNTFKNDQNIVYMKFPKGLTRIEDNAFKGCTALIASDQDSMKMRYPDSLVSIGISAFENNKSLSIVEFGSRSQLAEIKDRAFYNCDITGQMICPEELKIIGDSSFYGNMNMKELVLNSQLESIGNSAFEACVGLDCELTFGSNLIYVGSKAFYLCDKLRGELINPHTVVGNLAFLGTQIKYAGKQVSTRIEVVYEESDVNLAAAIERKLDELGTSVSDYSEIVVSTNGTQILKETDYKFLQDYRVVDISKCTLYNDCIATNAFMGNLQLVSIKLPDSLKIIGDRAFYGCSSLNESIDIKWNGLEVGNQAFYGCSNIPSITISASNVTIGDFAFAFCSHLEGIVDVTKLYFLGNGSFNDTKVKLIGQNEEVLIVNYDYKRGSLSEAYKKAVSTYGYNINQKILKIVGPRELILDKTDTKELLDILESTSNFKIVDLSELKEVKFDSIYYRTFKLDKLIMPERQETINEYALNADINTKASIGEIVMPKTLKTIHNAMSSTPVRKITFQSGDTRIDVSYGLQWNDRYNTKGYVEIIGSPKFNSLTPNADFLGNIVCDGAIDVIGRNVDTIYLNSIINGDLILTNTSPFKALGYSGQSKNLKVNGNLILEDATSLADGALWGIEVKGDVIAKNVTSVGVNAFNWAKIGGKIQLSDSGVTVSDSSFAYCRVSDESRLKINNAVIPSKCFLAVRNISIDATQATEIGNNAFACADVTNLDLGENLTKVGKYSFANARGVSQRLIKNSMTDIGDMAYEWEDLTTYSGKSVADFETRTLAGLVVDTSFRDSINKQSGYIGYTGNLDLSQSNVTTIGRQAFYGGSIYSAKLPNKQEYILGDYALSMCGLREVTLGKVTELGNTCLGTEAGRKITDDLYEGITKIGPLVFMNASIKNSTFDTRNYPKLLSIGERAFAYANENIKSVYLENRVTVVYYAFAFMPGLKEVYSDLTEASYTFCASTNIETVTFGDNTRSIIAATLGCENVKEWHLSPNVTKITGPDYATKTILNYSLVDVTNSFTITVNNKDLTLGDKIKELSGRSIKVKNGTLNFDNLAIEKLGNETYNPVFNATKVVGSLDITNATSLAAKMVADDARDFNVYVTASQYAASVNNTLGLKRMASSFKDFIIKNNEAPKQILNIEYSISDATLRDALNRQVPGLTLKEYKVKVFGDNKITQADVKTLVSERVTEIDFTGIDFKNNTIYSGSFYQPAPNIDSDLHLSLKFPASIEIIEPYALASGVYPFSTFYNCYIDHIEIGGNLKTIGNYGLYMTKGTGYIDITGVTSIGEGALCSTINLEIKGTTGNLTTLGGSALRDSLNASGAVIDVAILDTLKSKVFNNTNVNVINVNNVRTLEDNVFKGYMGNEIDFTQDLNIVYPYSMSSPKIVGHPTLDVKKITPNQPSALVSKYSFDGSGISGITIVSDTNSPTVIEVGAFSNCKNLDTIDLSDVNVMEIQIGSFEGSNATNVKLPKQIGVIYPKGLFKDFTKLYNLENEQYLESISDSMFENCSVLTEINLDDSVLKVIGKRAFAGCTGLSGEVKVGDPSMLGEDAFIGTSVNVVYTGMGNIDFTTVNIRTRKNGETGNELYLVSAKDSFVIEKGEYTRIKLVNGVGDPRIDNLYLSRIEQLIPNLKDGIEIEDNRTNVTAAVYIMDKKVSKLKVADSATEVTIHNLLNAEIVGNGGVVKSLRLYHSFGDIAKMIKDIKDTLTTFVYSNNYSFTCSIKNEEKLASFGTKDNFIELPLATTVAIQARIPKGVEMKSYNGGVYAPLTKTVTAEFTSDDSTLDLSRWINDFTIKIDSFSQIIQANRQVRAYIKHCKADLGYTNESDYKFDSYSKINFSEVKDIEKIISNAGSRLELYAQLFYGMQFKEDISIKPVAGFYDSYNRGMGTAFGMCDFKNLYVEIPVTANIFGGLQNVTFDNIYVKALGKLDTSYISNNSKNAKGNIYFDVAGDATFANCTNPGFNRLDLTGIKGNVTIGANAFKDSKQLTSVKFKSGTTINDFAFSGCGLTGSLILDEGVICTNLSAFNNNNFTGQLEINSSINNATIAGNKFSNEYLAVPKNVTTIGLMCNMDNLTTIEILGDVVTANLGFNSTFTNPGNDPLLYMRTLPKLETIKFSGRELNGKLTNIPTLDSFEFLNPIAEFKGTMQGCGFDMKIGTGDRRLMSNYRNGGISATNGLTYPHIYSENNMITIPQGTKAITTDMLQSKYGSVYTEAISMYGAVTPPSTTTLGGLIYKVSKNGKEINTPLYLLPEGIYDLEISMYGQKSKANKLLIGNKEPKRLTIKVDGPGRVYGTSQRIANKGETLNVDIDSVNGSIPISYSIIDDSTGNIIKSATLASDTKKIEHRIDTDCTMTIQFKRVIETVTVNHLVDNSYISLLSNELPVPKLLKVTNSTSGNPIQVNTSNILLIDTESKNVEGNKINTLDDLAENDLAITTTEYVGNKISGLSGVSITSTAVSGVGSRGSLFNRMRSIVPTMSIGKDTAFSTNYADKFTDDIVINGVNITSTLAGKLYSSNATLVKLYDEDGNETTNLVEGMLASAVFKRTVAYSPITGTEQAKLTGIPVFEDATALTNYTEVTVVEKRDVKIVGKELPITIISYDSSYSKIKDPATGNFVTTLVGKRFENEDFTYEIQISDGRAYNRGSLQYLDPITNAATLYNDFYKCNVTVTEIPNTSSLGGKMYRVTLKDLPNYTNIQRYRALLERPLKSVESKTITIQRGDSVPNYELMTKPVTSVYRNTTSTLSDNLNIPIMYEKPWSANVIDTNKVGTYTINIEADIDAYNVNASSNSYVVTNPNGIKGKLNVVVMPDILTKDNIVIKPLNMLIDMDAVRMSKSKNDTYYVDDLFSNTSRVAGMRMWDSSLSKYEYVMNLTLDNGNSYTPLGLSTYITGSPTTQMLKAVNVDTGEELASPFTFNTIKEGRWKVYYRLYTTFMSKPTEIDLDPFDLLVVDKKNNSFVHTGEVNGANITNEKLALAKTSQDYNSDFYVYEYFSDNYMKYTYRGVYLGLSSQSGWTYADENFSNRVMWTTAKNTTGKYYIAANSVSTNIMQYAAGSIQEFNKSGLLYVVALPNISVRIVDTASIVEHNVKVEAGEHGTTDPIGDVKVEDGENLEIVLRPDVGYEVDRVAIDGVSDTKVKSTDTKYVLENVTADINVKVTFKQKAYDVTITTSQNGTANPIGKTVVAHGNDLNIYPLPNEGYDVNRIEVNGVNQNVSSDISLFKLTEIKENSQVNIEFKRQQVTVTIETGDNGTTDPIGEIKVDKGEDLTVVMKPDPGYRTGEVTENGEKVPATGTQHTFTEIHADTIITVEFEKIKEYVDVIINSGENGSTTPGGTVQVEKGTDLTVLFTPDKGYQVDKVKENGIEVTTAANGHTFTNIQVKTIIDVSFKPIKVWKELKDIIKDERLREVPYGTTKEQAMNKLPKEAILVYTDNTREGIVLEGWENKNYNGEQTKDYPFNTEIKLPEYVKNPNNIDTGTTVVVRVLPKKEQPPIEQSGGGSPSKTRIKITFYIGDRRWYINDIRQSYIMDVTPQIRDGRSFVPIRFLSYALKVNPLYVRWDAKNHSANIKDGNNIMTLYEGQQVAYLNTKAHLMDTSSYVTQGRTMLPISQILAVYSHRTPEVKWDSKKQKVDIWLDMIADLNPETPETDWYIDYTHNFNK